MRSTAAAAGILAIAAAAATAPAQTIRITFDDLNLSQGPIGAFDLGFWFYDRNIDMIGTVIGTSLWAVKDTGFGGVEQVRASSGQIYFRQVIDQPPLAMDPAFIFGFRTPVREFSFTRPRILGTEASAVTFPAWTLEAHDQLGNVLASLSGPQIVATSDTPAQVCTIAHPGIRRVLIRTIDGSTLVPAMIVDDLVMVLDTCGSADFDGDGDAATDADIEAFFACLAGNCCPACDSADFNRDGDVATDADIEAFFRVLAGGQC
jgi:hypothetical protein